MSFLKKLFSGGGGSADSGIYKYVRCNACKEPIRIRLNPSADLSPVFEGDNDDATGYEVHKEILGNRCYKLMHATWRFDTGKRLTGAEIEGGTEITVAEYEAETATSQGQGAR